MWHKNRVEIKKTYLMSGRMNVLWIFIFCSGDGGDSSKAMLRFFLAIEIYYFIMFCMAHFKDGTSCIPKYVYVLFFRGWGVVVDYN